MAYVDGELAPEPRTAFEARLAQEPALRREVSELRKLELIARAAAPREPLDHEWAALARDPLQRGTLALGWILLGLGALGLAGYLVFVLCTCALPLALKLLLGALLAGGALLLAATLRARLRTLPHDPYTEVER
jgi:anti-sigma factor RsiW